METLIDELATRAKMDPIAYRRKLLKPEAKKLRAALDMLDQQSAWRTSLPKGHAAGVACHEVLGLRPPVRLRSRSKTSGRRFIARRLRLIAAWQSIR